MHGTNDAPLLQSTSLLATSLRASRPRSYSDIRSTRWEPVAFERHRCFREAARSRPWEDLANVPKPKALRREYYRVGIAGVPHPHSR